MLRVKVGPDLKVKQRAIERVKWVNSKLRVKMSESKYKSIPGAISSPAPRNSEFFHRIPSILYFHLRHMLIYLNIF